MTEQAVPGPEITLTEHVRLQLENGGQPSGTVSLLIKTLCLVRDEIAKAGRRSVPTRTHQ